MPDDTPETPSYTMGYSEEFRQMLDQRSAETHAVYLLPHLKPGHRVLDFGCGPGTISVGLARTVDPGEVHGAKFGLATQEQFDDWSASLDEWKADPAASGGVPFGECLAFNP